MDPRTDKHFIVKGGVSTYFERGRNLSNLKEDILEPNFCPASNLLFFGRCIEKMVGTLDAMGKNDDPNLFQLGFNLELYYLDTISFACGWPLKMSALKSSPDKKTIPRVLTLPLL